MPESPLSLSPLPAPECDVRFNLAAHCLSVQARRCGGKTALLLVGEGDAVERWTYAAMDEAVRRFAAGLVALVCRQRPAS